MWSTKSIHTIINNRIKYGRLRKLVRVLLLYLVSQLPSGFFLSMILPLYFYLVDHLRPQHVLFLTNDGHRVLIICCILSSLKLLIVKYMRRVCDVSSEHEQMNTLCTLNNFDGKASRYALYSFEYLERSNVSRANFPFCLNLHVPLAGDTFKNTLSSISNSSSQWRSSIFPISVLASH